MLLVSCTGCEGCAAVPLPSTPDYVFHGPRAAGLPPFWRGCVFTVTPPGWGFGCGDEVQSSAQPRIWRSLFWKG